MNAPIIDPLQGDFPEVIEEFLEHGFMKCIAFNRRGTLLAAGCSDGSCVVWDFETRGITKVLKDKDSIAAITSICWSKYGHCILVSAADKSLTLWDVVKGTKIARTIIAQTPLHARLHPGSSIPSICLACPVSSAPLIVDLHTSTTTVLPVSLSDTGNGHSNGHGNGNGNGGLSSRNKFSDGSPAFMPTAACFNKHGDLVYVGNSKGEILIVDLNSFQIRGAVPIVGSGVIKNISFSRNGLYLMTNSNDRTIRIYENRLPVKGALQALDELSNKLAEEDEVEKLKAVGSSCLALFREFQDSVTRVQWKAPCFSGDGEWVIGGSATKGEHKMYIWDRAGHLVKILEGPKEALIDLVWHPVHPIVVSVSLTGLVYIWAKDYTENWSAFAPDFKELEENEEYVEREDEFDLVPETEKVKDSSINEDEEIDVVTVEKDSAFSDSDMSQDEIRFLPADPCADVVVKRDRHVLSILKHERCSRSVSPFSEEAGLNGHLSNHESSPLEDDMGETHIKRKRKPSEMETDFDSEFSNKPLSKTKASR